jgi:MFS transporter, DHA1 family, tetracycline resistance protein
VSPSEQGQLQGANSAIMAITGLIGPVLFTVIFARFIGPQRDLHLPGAPFLVAMALMIVAMALAWRVTRARGALATASDPLSSAHASPPGIDP